MPRYKIVPVDRSCSSAEVTSFDAGAVLGIVDRLKCKEADVHQDGAYLFSARLDGNGMWHIFQRDHRPDRGGMAATHYGQR